MSELLNKLKSGEINNMNLFNSINQIIQSPSITYYQNNSFQNSILNINSPSNLNDTLMNNDEEQHPMDDENDHEPLLQTPKMNLNINSNDQNSKDDISHEEPQKEKSTNTETKNTTSKLNSSGKIEIIPTIQNIVSTAELNCQLRLKEIVLQVQNTQYEPKRFSGLIMRIKEPRTTSLIFSNGKIIVLGAKTEQDSEKACLRIRKILKSLNYDVKLTNFKIQNIVGSCDVRFQISLTKLNININKYVSSSRVAFEPEVFPGLIYRLIPDKSQNKENNGESPNIVLLIFASGKVVISGGKNRNQIYEAFIKAYPLLYQAKSSRSH